MGNKALKVNPTGSQVRGLGFQSTLETMVADGSLHRASNEGEGSSKDL